MAASLGLTEQEVRYHIDRLRAKGAEICNVAPKTFQLVERAGGVKLAANKSG